jgi:(p)ppGpp synthase/HD superfamily hydrolase
MYLKLGSMEEERALQLNSLVDSNAGIDGEKSFLKAINHIAVAGEKSQIFDAFNFATNMEYSHIGLSSAAYLLHPLRLARMAISFTFHDVKDIAVIALLHNVLEVSSVSKRTLEEKFGQLVATSISNLTVDRELQWNVEYKKNYYKRLNHGSYAARVVKIFGFFIA